MCAMGDGMMKGVLTGAVIGATAATVFGMMNWETERHWKNQAMRAGRCVANKADQLFRGC